MPISMKLKDHLDREGVPYTHRIHPLAYTSQEVAALAHIPGREMVKTVVLDADGKLVLAVLSANGVANLDILKHKIGCDTLRLATEDEFRDAFPTCLIGAMPPFGNVFGLPTYCESTLDQNSEIEFNAGTHHDTIRMSMSDFKRLEQPTIVHFAEPYNEHPKRSAA